MTKRLEEYEDLQNNTLHDVQKYISALSNANLTITTLKDIIKAKDNEISLLEKKILDDDLSRKISQMHEDWKSNLKIIAKDIATETISNSVAGLLNLSQSNIKHSIQDIDKTISSRQLAIPVSTVCQPPTFSSNLPPPPIYVESNSKLPPSLALASKLLQSSSDRSRLLERLEIAKSLQYSINPLDPKQIRQESSSPLGSSLPMHPLTVPSQHQSNGKYIPTWHRDISNSNLAWGTESKRKINSLHDANTFKENYVHHADRPLTPPFPFSSTSLSGKYDVGPLLGRTEPSRSNSSSNVPSRLLCEPVGDMTGPPSRIERKRVFSTQPTFISESVASSTDIPHDSLNNLDFRYKEHPSSSSLSISPAAYPKSMPPTQLFKSANPLPFSSVSQFSTVATMNHFNRDSSPHSTSFTGNFPQSKKVERGRGTKGIPKFMLNSMEPIILEAVKKIPGLKQ